MMSSFTQGSLVSRIAAAALLIMMIAAVGFVIVGPVWSLIESNTERIDAARQNLARFNALVAQEEQRRARRDPKSVPLGRADFLVGEHDPAILAVMQTRLRSLATEHRGQLVSSTALPSRTMTMTGTSVLGVRAQISAPLAGIQAMVHAIESGSPALFVDRAIMRLDDRSSTAGQAGGPERLILELDVFGVKWTGAE